MIKVGTVKSTVDTQQGGILTIKPLDSAEEIKALPCGQSVGAGHGFFPAPPGPGSQVLYVEMPGIEQDTEAGIFKYAWLGSVPQPIAQTKGRSSTANDKNDADDFNTDQRDPYARKTDKEHKTYDLGIPEAGNIYADNFLPQQDVWKQKNGHKVVLSHKITEKGRLDNSVLIQAASGKHLRLNDGPPEMGMDRIVLADEKTNNDFGPNRLEIISGGEHPDSAWLNTARDQNFISMKGSQNMELLGGNGDQRRTNNAEGDIEDSANKGNHNIRARLSVSRVAEKGNIRDLTIKGGATYEAPEGTIEIAAGDAIRLVVGSTTVTLTQTGININADSVSITGNSGDVVIDGTSLTDHIHGGVRSGGSVTSPPIT